MKKALIIAYYFPPLGWSGVQRTLKFVKYLRYYGWEPIVVTVGKTKFSILDESLNEEIPTDINVIRIDDVVLKDITDIMKKQMKEYIDSSINLISDEDLKQIYEKEIEKKFSELRDLLLVPDGNAIWANNVIKQIQNEINLEDIDIVYSTSSPYSTHIIGSYLKQTFNIPWVADFRDQWINNPYYDYDKNSLRYKLESNIEKNIITNCDRIVTTTSISRSNYINMYRLDDDKVVTITNGYDEEDFKNLNKINKYKNKFKIIHNGSFYLKRNPYTFVIAIRELLNDNLINHEKIQVILNGKNDDDIIMQLKNILNEYMDIISINGYISHKESLNKSLEANILLLVCGSEESSKEVYTGKVFEYLRLKRIILSISPKGSLVEKLLDETLCGHNVDYNDIEGMKKIILHYYNEWCNGSNQEIKVGNIEKYERKILTKRLAEIFDQIK